VPATSCRLVASISVGIDSVLRSPEGVVTATAGSDPVHSAAAAVRGASPVRSPRPVGTSSVGIPRAGVNTRGGVRRRVEIALR
jgi:hypothetical protein